MPKKAAAAAAKKPATKILTGLPFKAAKNNKTQVIRRTKAEIELGIEGPDAILAYRKQIGYVPHPLRAQGKHGIKKKTQVLRLWLMSMQPLMMKLMMKPS